jgi:N-acetylneuraminic acid mutarotase
MKKTILLIFLGLTYYASHAQSWVTKAMVPVSGIYGASGFSIGTKGYIVAGDANGNYSTTLWEYDKASNTWTTKASFPGATRIHAVAFSIGNKGYVGTGMGLVSGASLNDWWEYDQSTDTWTQKTNFMGTARRFAVGFEADGKGYVGTGWDASGLKDDFYEYDPVNNSWSAVANYPRICYSASAFTIGSKGYVCTGFDGNTLPFPNDFYEYDPALNQWTAKAPLPQTGNVAGSGRDMAFSFAIGSKGYIGTGNYVDMSFSGFPIYCQDFWEYDQPLDMWTQRASFPGGNRQWTIGFGLGDKGYAGTGECGLVYFSDFYQFPDDLTAMEELSASPEILIYSDAEEQAIQIRSARNETFTIEIYDALSHLMYNGSAKQFTSVRTSSWSTGIYFVKVSDESLNVTRKVLVY